MQWANLSGEAVLALVADATTIFYLTLLFIFLTAIVTTVAAKWSRDKCLKFLGGYRVTLERGRGSVLWGKLKVFSAGVEVGYDRAYIDPHGHLKTSYLFYQQELDQQILSILRYHGTIDAKAQKMRLRQVHKSFNPNFFRRNFRRLRNVVNTLRDAFNAAIGTAVVHFQRESPGGPVWSAQTGAVTNLGQTIIGKIANAYEPLLEQYIGQPVILQVADPINPNNVTQEYSGYLADYTQQFIAVFNVEHRPGESFELMIPDVESGDLLPPLPPPVPPGAPAPALPPPIATQAGVQFRIDGRRMLLHNTTRQVLLIEVLEKEGYEPLEMGVLLPPSGTASLPATDARRGRLECRTVECLDVVAPRRYATVRHAGELVRRTLVDDLQLDRLPLVSRLFASGNNVRPDEAEAAERRTDERNEARRD